MAAKVYGDGVWGMTAENGMYAQDFSVDYSIDETYFPDESGDDVGAAFSNAGGTISLNGFVKTSGTAFSSTLGASLALANAIDANDFVTGAVDDAAGETITTSIKRGAQSRAFKSFDVGAVFKPFLSAVQV